MKLNQNAIDSPTWSPSRVIMALQCPFNYNRSLEKSPIKVYADDSDARIGTAVHSYIETLLKSPELANNKDFFIGIYQANKLTRKELTRFELLRPVANKSISRINSFKKKHEVKEDEFWLELDLAITKDFKPTAFFSKEAFFRGKIDLCMRLSNGIIAVVDHKSGNIGEVSDTYKLQLNSYAVLFEYGLPTPKPEISGYSFYLNILGGDNPDIVNSSTVQAEKFSEDLFNPLIEAINRAADNVKTNNACPGYYCRFCNYTDICPAKATIPKI